MEQSESAEHLPRRHKTRSLLTRTTSAPASILSLTTTTPIHINNPRCAPCCPPHRAALTPFRAAMASLMPNRAESFNTRTRGTSHIDFKTATTGVAAKAMRNEISHLVATVDDPLTKKVAIVLNTISDCYRLTMVAPFSSSGFRHRNAVFLLSLHALSRRARKERRPVSLRALGRSTKMLNVEQINDTQ